MKEVERQAAAVMDSDAVAIAAEDGLVVDIPLRTVAEHGPGTRKAPSESSLSDGFERLEVGSAHSNDSIEIVNAPGNVRV